MKTISYTITVFIFMLIGRFGISFLIWETLYLFNSPRWFLQNMTHEGEMIFDGMINLSGSLFGVVFYTGVLAYKWMHRPMPEWEKEFINQQ